MFLVKRKSQKRFSNRNIMKEMLGMEMGESQFYTGCKVFPFPPNIFSSVCLRTFFLPLILIKQGQDSIPVSPVSV